MVSTPGFIFFGAILVYEFFTYWIGILGTYFCAAETIQNEKELWEAVGRAEDLWVRFWMRSALPLAMIFFCFYLKGIGL